MADSLRRRIRRAAPLPRPSLRHRLVGVIVAVVVLPLVWVWIAGTFEFTGVAWLKRDVGTALEEAVAAGTDPARLERVARRHAVHLRVFREGSAAADVDRSTGDGWFSRMVDPFYGPEGRPDLRRHDRNLPPVPERPEANGEDGPSCTVVERGLLLVCSAAVRTDDGRLVHVTKGSPRFVRTLYEQRLQLTVMTLVMLVIGVVLALLLGWRMVGPLEQLRNQVVERTRGAVSTEPIEMDRDDEIGELATAFNQLLRALDDRNRSNSAFAADLAHELKNPVAAVRAATEALAADRPVEGERLERLRRVLGDAGNRMEVVVNQFLAIARAEAGLPGAEREDVDLCALVNQLVETARGDERNARVRIAVDGCPARIRAVPERLETAIRNLLANACFYAEGQVDVALTVGPGEVALTVADDGPGLPEADLPRLFTRYHSSRPGGTGLGLAMAKAIVEAHGGSLEADAGRGATFRIRLPLA